MLIISDMPGQSYGISALSASGGKPAAELQCRRKRKPRGSAALYGYGGCSAQAHWHKDLLAVALHQQGHRLLGAGHHRTHLFD